MIRKVSCVILTLMLMASLNAGVYADDSYYSGEKNSSTAKASVDSESDKTDQDDDDDEDSDDNEADLDDLEDEEENEAEEEKVSEMADALEEQMEALDDLLDEIEDQIEDAIDAGDPNLAAELEAKLDTYKDSVESILEQYEAAIQARRELIKARYTTDEISSIQKAVNSIKAEDLAVTILGFDSVFSNIASFKFDTPPIIKGGRTLVPIRAVTEGFGADVKYTESTHTVTIVKNGATISFTVGSNEAIVNGSTVALDTRADIKNGRTYVPLRFVLEALNLDVHWDDKTKTIEINDPAADPSVTAPGKI